MSNQVNEQDSQNPVEQGIDSQNLPQLNQETLVGMEKPQDEAPTTNNVYELPEQGTSRLDHPMTDTVENLSHGIQQCALNQTFDEVMSGIVECTDALQHTTPATIQLVTNVIPHFITYQTQADIPISQHMALMRALHELNIAVQNRHSHFASTTAPQQTTPEQSAPQQPSTPVQTQMDTDLIPPPVRTGPTVVKFKFLHQFITDMAFNTVSAASTKLDQAAQRQLQRYNDYSVRIDHVQHQNSPLRNIFSLRSQDFFLLQHLRKNQCEYLMARIAPQGNRTNTAMLDFPTFNPDYQFSWTIVFVSPENLRCFEEFTDTHLASQQSLPVNKDLSTQQIMARFAFQQGARWIRIKLDIRMNADLNERDAFCISNGFAPYMFASVTRKYSRVLFPRDKNTLAWDGEHIFAYSSDEAAFMKTFYRWSNVSPILQFGNYRVDILHHNALPSLPDDMPTPREYEQIIPLCCHWASATKLQLVKHLRDKFCPTLGVGGIYLPRFADSNYAVSGKLIRAQPRFYSEISEEQEDSYFSWNIQEGRWKPYTQELSSSPQYEQYVQTRPEPIVTQNEQWENIRMYDTQPLDQVYEPQYGSMHFWFQYNRLTPTSQILLSGSILTPQFGSGFNPFKPAIKDDPMVELLFSYQNPQSDLEFQFQNFITNNCNTVPELAIRYRRQSTIVGYNSSHLNWRTRTLSGIYYKNRMPTSMELLYIPLSANAVQQLRPRCTQLSFIPKELASHIDEDTNTYYPHKKDCLRIKSNRHPSDQYFVQRSKKPRH